MPIAQNWDTNFRKFIILCNIDQSIVRHFKQEYFCGTRYLTHCRTPYCYRAIVGHVTIRLALCGYLWGLGGLLNLPLCLRLYTDQAGCTACIKYSWLMTSEILTHELTNTSSRIKQQRLNNRYIILYFTAAKYLVRWPEAHINSCCQSFQTERWHIWRVVDCTDNTERLLLQQVQRLDTDHTTCSSTGSVLMWED